MPETKQVGVRCHGPDQQRLGPAANSLDPGAEGPPCFTGEATENRVAILRPALTEEEAEAGFQLQEEVGPPDPDTYTSSQPEVAAAVPIWLPTR